MNLPQAMRSTESRSTGGRATATSAGVTTNEASHDREKRPRCLPQGFDMGSRIEVSAWLSAGFDGNSNFYDHQVYGGGNLLRALFTAARWHRKCGCVTIKWRPR